MDDLLRQKDDILNKISNLESSLNDLDNCIDQLEEELLQDGDTEGVMILGQQGEASMDPTPTQEHLTDPTSQAQTQQQQQRQRPSVGRVSLETQLTEPGFQTQILEEEDDEDEEGIFPNQSASRPARPSSAGSTFGQLEITTVAKKKRAPKANNSSTISNNAAAGTARIDNFFAQNNIAQRSLVPPPAAAAATAASTNTTTQSPATFVAAPTTAAVAAAISNSHSITSNNQFNRSDFPWSNQVHNLLRNTFRIESFREHQEAVINATLAKEDVFVIMRTGGGKSLTYQLTALLEGRGQPRGQPGQITFVISPLLSLIKDQEDQMNQFARGSAISFSSNLPGGQSEHARRWGLVRDPSAGVCLVFVTPEKVHASNKLKSELQKLHEQNRLGRFVIDECHCASSWGHDFRPDYTKLGILRHHFPRVPILAVTATASDRVRTDVCDILNMSHKYNFFRSSANRPNLTYEVRPKKSSGSGDAVLDDMAAFIKERYPDAAGIVYTLSKKDANTVAGKLLEHGILAEPYHSDVGASKKAEVHQNWMSNRTKVVVATVAFGLGINKPDVRYVLHHSISKNLEAYYQESGRK